MAMKDFIPLKDVKQTTEKEVKPKPTTAELTKIEKPGSLTKNSLESEKTPKKTQRKKPTSKPSKISQPKRDSILIITEKPQAAQKIALALGKPKKQIEGRVSYFQLEKNGEKIIVASAVGHLFNLTYSQGQRGWPLFKLEWRPSYERKSAAFTKSYFNLLKKLSKKAKEFIIATDYDIEGEVIGWNVLRFICKKETAKRMKYSTLTIPELKKSFENTLPTLNWGQAYAGETRHYVDWLYGINLSRALMSAIKKTGSFKILSIGRVQGPALKIIVDREKEIINFTPEPFWQISALYNNIPFKHPKDIFDQKALEKFKNIKHVEALTKKREESISPPHPFDLTTLQREAYRWHKINPSKTLSIAQRLYLDSLISYPRTSSQKIPDSIQPKKILKTLSKYFPETKLATRQKPIEGKKSDPAHPSIYATGEYKSLAGDDKKVYDLIAKRFIAAFSPNAKTTNKRITLTALDIKDEDNKPIIFTANGLKVLEKGWTQVYPVVFEEKHLPDLEGKIKINEIKIEDKETQPPKRFTPTSLISLLEKKGLGTKTTRSHIVDILFDRDYLYGRSIQATPLGMKLIETLEKHSPIIIDENLTRQLEEEMEKIQHSNSDLKQKEQKVLEKVSRLITDISKEFKTKELEIGKDLLRGIEKLRHEQQENNTLTLCPTCKKGKLRIIYSKKTKRNFIACSSYPECTQTYNIPPNALIKKSGRDCESCAFPKLLSIKKGKRPWEFCFNQECPIVKKQRAEWERKHKPKQ